MRIILLALFCTTLSTTHARAEIEPPDSPLPSEGTEGEPDAKNGPTEAEERAAEALIEKKIAAVGKVTDYSTETGDSPPRLASPKEVLDNLKDTDLTDEQVGQALLQWAGESLTLGPDNFQELMENASQVASVLYQRGSPEIARQFSDRLLSEAESDVSSPIASQRTDLADKFSREVEFRRVRIPQPYQPPSRPASILPPLESPPGQQAYRPPPGSWAVTTPTGKADLNTFRGRQAEYGSLYLERQRTGVKVGSQEFLSAAARTGLSVQSPDGEQFIRQDLVNDRALIVFQRGAKTTVWDGMSSTWITGDQATKIQSELTQQTRNRSSFSPVFLFQDPTPGDPLIFTGTLGKRVAQQKTPPARNQPPVCSLCMPGLTAGNPLCSMWGCTTN